LSAATTGRPPPARRRGPLEAILFWIMLLIGVSVMAPCLLLPAWLEHQAARACLRERTERVAQLEAHLLTLEKQIEHMKTDPAYVLRLAEAEYGHLFPELARETIPVATAPARDSAVHTTAPAEPETEPPLQLAGYLEQMLARYPQSWAFVQAPTRHGLMLMAGVLIVAAIVLLGRSHPE
jgi:hypothetical protein